MPPAQLLGLPALALGNGAQLVGRRFHDRDVLQAGRPVADLFQWTATGSGSDRHR